MVDAVVQTKLVLPRLRPELVARPRLTGELDRAQDAALVLVSAPAGFGKTTLLASVLTHGPPVAWVSLDTRDSDPARFWSYALRALENASPGCASAALAQLEQGRGSIEDVVATLVNELSVRAGDLTLVLDDYHLADSTEVGESVSLLLMHRPPQLRLIISTRADPVLPLPRLRARGAGRTSRGRPAVHRRGGRQLPEPHPRPGSVWVRSRGIGVADRRLGRGVATCRLVVTRPRRCGGVHRVIRR